VRLLLTPGQAGDAPQAAELLTGLEPEHVVADAAYDSADLRAQIRRSGGKACIKPHSNRKVKRRYDRQRYKHRNVIERFFGAIKRFRRVATRYDKKAANFLGFAWLASILVNLG
jgi:transposase